MDTLVDMQNPLVIPGGDRCELGTPESRGSGDVWGFKQWYSQGIYI